MTDFPRPQALGALPFPAGMLVIGSAIDVPEIRETLALANEPTEWPAQLEFMQLALADDAEAAALCIADTDPISLANRAALVGGDEAWAAAAAAATGELAALVDVGRYTVGLLDAPPAPDTATGEVRAMVLSAWASHALESGSAEQAFEYLREGVSEARSLGAHGLAGSLALTLSTLQRDALGDPVGASLEADRAITSLPLNCSRELRAELQISRALARQQVAGTERGALLAVVADLTEATKIFREDSHPELFALCNLHLGLAYIIMPMSDEGDRIRIGVAVNSLRAALRIYTREEYPQEWASTQLNLANALQYLPSVHQEDNLDEAVQLYEELLQVRTPEADPIGYARILANQGNALGHLGVFEDAASRLTTARDIFRAVGDDETAAEVESTLTGLKEAASAAGKEIS
jgi:tetratricopeptide (TPR) repeat protein